MTHSHGSRGRRLSWLLCGVALGAFLAPSSGWSQDDEDEEQAVRLAPVVVTATATEHDTLTSPSFTTVIDREEIENAPASNGLPDLLRRYVGVNNSSDNNGRDEVVMRGLGNGYVLMLVNGKRVSSSSALWRGGDFDFHSMPLSAIERIEIVRGPMSALYGSDAMGGVVNIITREPEDGKWTGSIGADYRYVDSGKGGDQRSVDFYLSGPVVDGMSANFSGEFYDRDAWSHDSKDKGTVSALEEKTLKDFSSEINWAATESQDVSLRYGLQNDRRPYQSYDTVPSYRAQEITRHTVGLSHDGRWSWGTSLLEGSFETSDIDDFNTSYNAPSQRSLTEENTFLHGRSTVPLDAQMLGRHALTGGMEFSEQVVKDAVSYQTTGRMEIQQTALYLQDEISLTDDLTLTLGSRLDDHEIFGDHVTSRANLVYQLMPGVSLKGGYSEGFKAPDAYQLSPEYRIVSCGGACFISGDPNLKPETSRGGEIGFEIQQKSWDLSVAGFSNLVEDMITTRYSAGPPRARWWVNESSVRLKGVEVSGSVDLSEEVLLSGNYSYLTTLTSAGSELENRPRHKSTVNLAWEFIPDYTATASANFTGSQLEGTNKLPTYRTFDLGLVADVRKDLSLRAGVQNLTDVVLTDEDSRFLQHELGRNYYVGATYRF